MEMVLKMNPDCDTLQNDNHPSEIVLPLQILKSGVEKTIHYLENEKSPIIDNVASKLIRG